MESSYEKMVRYVIPSWAKKAAIIGFYRQGATVGEIAEIMGILESTIDQVINEYLNYKQ